MTYMAVEQAAFVTCNSFRLLEVFNRHVKLKEEDACGKERKQVDKEEENSETSQRMKTEYEKKKCRHMHTRTRK